MDRRAFHQAGQSAWAAGIYLAAHTRKTILVRPFCFEVEPFSTRVQCGVYVADPLLQRCTENQTWMYIGYDPDGKPHGFTDKSKAHEFNFQREEETVKLLTNELENDIRQSLGMDSINKPAVLARK